jgi:hypothetical protein
MLAVYENEALMSPAKDGSFRASLEYSLACFVVVETANAAF